MRDSLLERGRCVRLALLAFAAVVMLLALPAAAHAQIPCVDDSECDDGDVCNGAEICGAGGECEAGQPLVCDDGDVCNGDETCDPVDGCEDGTPLLCDDGNVCNGAETCDPAVGCEPGLPLICDDGDACNGDEICDPVLGCQDGTPPVCDDGDVCNGDETCDPALGCQDGTPLVCDDGDACNGDETCDPALGCQDGTPPVCDDQDVCNGVETCDPAVGCVDGTPLQCDDGDVCNGDETCDPAAGCQDGMPLNCDDENPCTADSCDSVDGCMNDCDPSLDDSCYVEIGDYVWHDEGSDGIQEEMAGIPDVEVEILRCDDSGAPAEVVGMTTTDADGFYLQRIPSCDDESLAVRLVDVNFEADGVLAGLVPSPQDQGDDDTVDSDCDQLTHETVCNDVERGTTNDTVDCGFHPPLCRSAGFWGSRGGDEHRGRGRKQVNNITQAAIDAAGGFLNVCGEIIDSTVPVGDLDSALEALCVRTQGVKQRQLFRQLTAAALNCALSGAADCDSIVPGFDECDLECSMGENADPKTTMRCMRDIACFNEGGKVNDDGVCYLGYCSVDGEPCGAMAGSCDMADVDGDGDNDNTCVPFEDSCKTIPLCDSPEQDLCFKPIGPASSPRACQEARKNDCTIDSCD